MEAPERDVGEPGPLDEEDPLPEEKARMDEGAADAGGERARSDAARSQEIPEPGAGA